MKNKIFNGVKIILTIGLAFNYSLVIVHLLLYTLSKKTMQIKYIFIF